MLHPHEGGLQRISELHHAYTPLYYVLMFPRGENGWHPNIPICVATNIQDENKSEINNNKDEESELHKYVTTMIYFAYHFQISHLGKTLTLHWYGHLFQQ